MEYLVEIERQNDCNWTFSLTYVAEFINNSNNLLSVVNYDNNGYAIAAFALLFVLVGLPWNALVIGIIIKKKLFTRPTYMLLLNLAIANLLVCVLVLPLAVVTGFGGEMLGSRQVRNKVCQTAVFLILLPLVSTHTVTLLAIDRLIYIRKPLAYKFIVSPGKMLAAIVVVWILCIGLSLPPPLIGSLFYGTEIRVCMVNFTVFQYMIPMVVETSLVVFLQCLMCVWMICITRKYLKQQFLQGMADVALFRSVFKESRQDAPQNRRNSGEVQKEYNKSQLHLVKIFVAIFTASIVTFLMVLTLAIYQPICGRLPPPFYPVVYLLYLSRAIIHPIVEAVMTKEIRSSIVQNCLPTGMEVCCRKREERGEDSGVDTRQSNYDLK